MGRFILFLIIIAAAVAGAWFYMPGGKDMLLDAKDKAMGYMPGGATGDATAEPIVEEIEPIEEVAEESMATVDEAPAEEPQH